MSRLTLTLALTLTLTLLSPQVKECEEDVKAECEEVSSGKVVYCVVPTKDDLKGMDEGDVGKSPPH